MIQLTETDGLKGEELEKVVNDELEQFEEWFRNHLDSEPLARAERSILKTYLWYKTHPGEVPTSST